MQYVVSLSGGIASAVATERAIERYGKEPVSLWIADTDWEDEDLWRFVHDCCNRWQIIPVIQKEGRTPLQVAEDHKIISNSRVAPCSFELKIKPFRKYLESLVKPATVLLGLDWREQHRLDAPRKNYEAIPGVTVDYPLLWKPLEFRAYTDVVKSWGIEPPRLYAMGFSHNNCGGRCVKQGIKEWQRLKAHFPERFAEVRDWEQAQRKLGGTRADRAILKDRTDGNTKPLTLLELESRDYVDSGTPIQEDMFSCFCSY